MRLANVYRLNGTWYLHAMSETTAKGLWLATPPYVSLQGDVATAELGERLLEVLSGSTHGIPHPQEFTGKEFRPVLELAEVKSWSQFQGNAACVSVRSQDESLVFEPHKNAGSKSGFQLLRNQVFAIEMPASPEVIGEALQEAFARSE